MMDTSRILLTVAVLALVGCGKEKGHSRSLKESKRR